MGWSLDTGCGKMEVSLFFSMLLCQVDARTELSPSSKVQCHTIIYVYHGSFILICFRHAATQHLSWYEGIRLEPKSSRTQF